MTLTREEFDEWRSSRAGTVVFETLVKHAHRVRQQGMESAWAGDASESFLTACRAEYKILTQLVEMTFEDFNTILGTHDE